MRTRMKIKSNLLLIARTIDIVIFENYQTNLMDVVVVVYFFFSRFFDYLAWKTCFVWLQNLWYNSVNGIETQKI